MRLLIFFCILASSACSSKKAVPTGIIKPEKMQQVVFDLLKADEFIANYKSKDTTVNKRQELLNTYQQVFSIHRVTKEEFFKSYKYYQEHPDLNKNLFDSLYNRANKPKDTARNLQLKHIL